MPAARQRSATHPWLTRGKVCLQQRWPERCAPARRPTSAFHPLLTFEGAALAHGNRGRLVNRAEGNGVKESHDASDFEQQPETAA